MKNTDIMILTLTRAEAIDLRMACSAIKRDFLAEAQQETTTAERREIARASAAKWDMLRHKIVRQMDEQDTY